jgi:nucleoside 2-deoxyribosyltransferase
MDKRVCLCGSFRFFVKIREIEALLTSSGIFCFSPQPFEFRDGSNPSYFKDKWDLLSYEEKLDVSRDAEQSFLEKIDKADVLYVINPSGYVGSSVLFEIGYAFAKEKLIFSMEPIQDHAIRGLVKRTATPEDIAYICRQERS